MNHQDTVIRGIHCHLRPVRVEDAEFIVSIRNDPGRSRHISQGAASTEAQRQWIQAYLERRAAGQEYYFIACDHDGESRGTARLYRVSGDECTAGSWVMRPDAPPPVSLETFLLLLRFAFHDLAKQVLHIDVRKANTRVWKWHEVCGAIYVSEDHLDRFYYYTPAVYPVVEKRIYSAI